MNATPNPELESIALTGLRMNFPMNHRAYALGYACATPFGGSHLI